MEPQIQQIILDLLGGLVKKISPDSEIHFEKEADQWRVHIKKAPEMINEDTQELLSSLQHLIRVGVHQKFPEDRTHFLIDIDEYRSKREYIIKTKIPELAQDRVLAKGQTIVMTGLSSYERMLVHNLLAEVDGLETNSVGASTNRKLLIVPTSEFGSTTMEESLMWDINKQ